MINFFSGNEFSFYKIIEKDKKRKKENRKFEIIKVPRVYFQGRNTIMKTQTIVMEDLAPKGYNIVFNPAGCTEQSVYCVFKKLQKLQEKWMNKKDEVLEILSDEGFILPSYFSPFSPPKVIDKKISIEKVERIIEKYYSDFGNKEGLRNMTKLMNLYVDNREKIESYLEKYGDLKTLSHNDFKPDNVFIKDEKIKLIDLASVSYDYLTNDLLYFIFWVVEDVGIDNIEKFLEEYCSSFSKYNKEYMMNAIKELSVRHFIHVRLLELTGKEDLMGDQMEDTNVIKIVQKFFSGLLTVFERLNSEEILNSILTKVT